MKNSAQFSFAQWMPVSAFLFHSLKISEMNVIYCMSAVGILSVSLEALKKMCVICNEILGYTFTFMLRHESDPYIALFHQI